MAVTPPPGWSPPPRRARARRAPVRWGLPDALLVWLAGIVGGVVGSVVGASVAGASAEQVADDPWVFALGILGQFGAMVATLAWVSHHKGRGRLAVDFGARIRVHDAWFLGVGLAFQIGAGILLLPIASLDGRRQQVVEQIQQASGGRLVVLAVSAGILAPVVEELLFRGLLLRALLRRTSATAAIAWTGLAFGLVHLLDPDAIVVVPGVSALGAFAAYLTVRSGDLSRAIWLHAGFNALVVVQALVG